MKFTRGSHFGREYYFVDADADATAPSGYTYLLIDRDFRHTLRGVNPYDVKDLNATYRSDTRKKSERRTTGPARKDSLGSLRRHMKRDAK